MTVRELRELLERKEREGYGPNTVAHKQNNREPGTKNILFVRGGTDLDGRVVIE